MVRKKAPEKQESNVRNLVLSVIKIFFRESLCIIIIHTITYDKVVLYS